MVHCRAFACRCGEIVDGELSQERQGRGGCGEGVELGGGDSAWATGVNCSLCEVIGRMFGLVRDFGLMW